MLACLLAECHGTHHLPRLSVVFDRYDVSSLEHLRQLSLRNWPEYIFNAPQKSDETLLPVCTALTCLDFFCCRGFYSNREREWKGVHSPLVTTLSPCLLHTPLLQGLGVNLQARCGGCK